MKCEKCAAFDAETMALMDKLFGGYEKMMLTTMLATSLKFYGDAMKKFKQDDPRKFQMKRDMDISALMVGKFLISFKDNEREQIIERFQKQYGLAVKIDHEKCPHTIPIAPPKDEKVVPFKEISGV